MLIIYVTFCNRKNREIAHHTTLVAVVMLSLEWILWYMNSIEVSEQSMLQQLLFYAAMQSCSEWKWFN